MSEMQPTPNAIKKDILYALSFAPEPTQAPPEKMKSQSKTQEGPEPAPEEKPTETQGKEGKRVYKKDPTHGETDKDGFLGDERLHEKGKDGKFRTWPEGKFLKRKKGWAAGMAEIMEEMGVQEPPIFESAPEVEFIPLDTPTPPEPEPQAEEQPSAASTESRAAHAQQLAQFVVDQCWISSGYMMFGKEWLPVEMTGVEGEREYLIRIWAENLEESEVLDHISKRDLLILAHFNYAKTRFLMKGRDNQPSNFRLFTMNWARKAAGIFRRKKKKTPENHEEPKESEEKKEAA